MPNPFPNPTNNVGHQYPEFLFTFQYCTAVLGEGELQENFEQDALFHKGTQKHKILRLLSSILQLYTISIAVLPQTLTL